MIPFSSIVELPVGRFHAQEEKVVNGIGSSGIFVSKIENLIFYPQISIKYTSIKELFLTFLLYLLNFFLQTLEKKLK